MYNQYNPYMYQNTYIPQQQYTQAVQPAIQKNYLVGKIVDNLEVVKGTEIPMDGSVSYFPLADKTTIATKQLMMDGTSKITIYKQVEEKEKVQTTFITKEDLESYIKNDDIDDLKEEIKDIKKQLKGMSK